MSEENHPKSESHASSYTSDTPVQQPMNPVQAPDEEASTSLSLSSELTWRSGLATAGASMALFTSVGFLNAFGVFQDYYSQDVLRDKSASQISWLGSFSTFAVFVFGLPAGWMADRMGPRLPLALGSLLTVVAIMLTSICKQYWQFFLAQALLLGLGMSFIATPAVAIVPRHFTKYRATASGFAVGGSSLGGILWPIIFNELFHRDGVSFGWSMRIAGFIMIPLLVFAVLATRSPIEQGVLPRQEEAGNVKDEERGVEQRGQKLHKLAALKKPPFIFLCIGLLLFNLGFYVPTFYVTVYGVAKGFTVDLSYYLIATLNVGSLLGRVSQGFVADRFGRFNLITISAFAAGVCGFCWSSATNVAGVIVWSITYGFASGAILSLQFACASTLADKDTAGTIIGTTMSAVSLAGLFCAPIAGAILPSGWGAMTWYTGATIMAGAVCLALSRFAQSRSFRARL